MPHLEEQFPPVNPLVLQRPDALDPPGRTGEEAPIPGSVADGIDRVTISANARAIAPVQQTGETVPAPLENTVNPAVPAPLNREAQRFEARNPDASADVASSLTDTRQVFEKDQQTQALQTPAFPELDPNAPFLPNLQPEPREENIPAVAQQPLNVPPPAVENVVAPVAPPIVGNVEALNENPQALRRDFLGTDPALRSNRALRNFLQENRSEPPETATEPARRPITEVQNNAPPTPAGFENLEAVRAELPSDQREPEATQGVTRPEEERTAPPEPRTPETVLTERGQNIDRFI